jgi:hypothetical protein
MAIQWAGIPNVHYTRDEVGAPNLSESIMQGFQVGAAPRQLAADLLSKQLDAKMKQANLGMVPLRQKILQESLAAKQRENQLLSENPLLNRPGILGNIGAYKYLQDHPELFGQQKSKWARQPHPLKLVMGNHLFSQHLGSKPNPKR